MTDLCKSGLVESHRRAINEPAVWRLSRKGKKALGITKRRVAPLGYRIPHYTGIVDALIWLILNGKLGDGLEVEPRYKLRYKGKERVFQPDAAFTWNNSPFYLEYQSHRTDLTAKGWHNKWELRHEFYRRKLWQERFKEPPTILVLSRQDSSKVKTGADGLPIRVMKDISQLVGWWKI